MEERFDRTEALRALSDHTRLKIVVILMRNSYCVRALAGSLSMTESAVSQHMKVLRETGLVEGERKGHHVHYNVRRDRLLGLSDFITELASITPGDPLPREFSLLDGTQCSGHHRRILEIEDPDKEQGSGDNP